MKHLVKAIVEFKIGRREQEAKTYYEGFIAYGNTKKEAVDQVYALVRMKRDQFDFHNHHNFIGLTVLPERDLNTLHRHIQQRVRTDWALKLASGGY